MGTVISYTSQLWQQRWKHNSSTNNISTSVATVVKSMTWLYPYVMEMTKVVKPFIRSGRPNTFGNIVYITDPILDCRLWYLGKCEQSLISFETLHEILLRCFLKSQIYAFSSPSSLNLRVKRLRFWRDLTLSVLIFDSEIGLISRLCRPPPETLLGFVLTVARSRHLASADPQRPACWIGQSALRERGG